MPYKTKSFGACPHGLKLLLLGLASLGLLGGCSDALVGKWRGLDDVGCSNSVDRVRFEVEDDLSGSGDVCDCDFDFDAENRGGGRYRLDVDFDEACGIGLNDAKYDCDLNGDGDKLNCGDLGDYKLVE